jgi:DNA-binding CsgD family transcriptional regulator
MDQRLVHVIDQFYDGAADAHAWPTALGSLCTLVRAHHAVVLLRRTAEQTTPFVASAGVDPVHLDRFAEHATEIDRIAQGLAPLSIVPRAALLPDREAVRTAFYHDVIRPMDGFRAMLTVPWRHGGCGGLLAVCRPRRARDFSAAEAGVIGRLVPHIGRALKMRLKCGDGDRRGAVAIATLERLGAAVAIVDPDLRCVFLSRQAEGVVTRGDGLTLARGVLSATMAGESRELKAAVRRLAAEDARVSGTVAVRLTRRPSRPPWHAILHRLSPDDAGRGGPPLVAIFLEDGTLGADDLEWAIRGLFDLTPREAAVAAALARGQDVAAAARHLGIAPGTTRNHLKAVFLKTGTRRQGELVSLILRLTRFTAASTTSHPSGSASGFRPHAPTGAAATGESTR